MKKVLSLVLCLMLIPGVSSASWLSEITGVDINIPAGTVEIKAPNPAAIPKMLENLPKDVGQALLNPAGAALATAIRHAASQANYGAQPIPSDVRRILAPFFPANILDGTRWNMYDPNRITLDSAITGIFQGEGAITLDNVIVFSSREEGQTDWFLWAHELTHAIQYKNMGVEGFANIYSVNWDSLEGEARSWAEQVKSTVQRQWAQQDSSSLQEPARWQQERFYSMDANMGNRQLTSQDFSRAAQQYYPPASCVLTRESPQALWVENICPIPVRVTGWTQRHPYTGMLIPVNCWSNCWVAPGVNAPFQSQAPGPMVTVGYSYN